MTKITMEYVKDFKANGGVAEIKGLDEKYGFDFEWNRKPSIIKKAEENTPGIHKYELQEGKYYLIKYPFKKAKSNFATVKNGEIIKVRRMDAKKYVEETFLQQVSTIFNNNNLPSNKLSAEVNFVLENLDEAFAAKETIDGNGIYQGMAIVTWNYALEYDVKTEYLQIKDEFENGNSIEEIQEMLESQISSKSEPTRIFNMDKYKNIV